MLIVIVMTTFVGAESVPDIYSGINIQKPRTLFFWKKSGPYFLTADGQRLTLQELEENLVLDKFRSAAVPTENGFKLDFQNRAMTGRVYFGIMSPDSRYPSPVYLGRFVPIIDGFANISLDHLRGKYDISDWETTGTVHLGYRVVRNDGIMLYEGRLSLAQAESAFVAADYLVEGPFVSLLNHEGAVISFDCSQPVVGTVEIDGRQFSGGVSGLHHEIRIDGLNPDRTYEYTVHAGSYSAGYTFRTAPSPGSRKPFSFGYASDSRTGAGGGERSMFGVNAYMMRRIGALGLAEDIRFMQFTGDLVSGYRNTPGTIDLEYANWKKSIEAYAHYIPFIAGMGNHEALGQIFSNGEQYVFVDRYPFSEESAEAVFSRHFVNPLNGPVSEDGAVYDPNPNQPDFPSYKENVFYYTYDNIAVIVLNSNYWYAPSITAFPGSGGNLHGYIMDQQLNWLEETLEVLTAEPNIDHIFLTQHTPIFPNGGHVGDDMWYSGNNAPRATVAGIPLENGIIERRDQYLKLLLDHKKVLAVFTGDEHNYNRLLVSGDTNIYPEEWEKDRLDFHRPLWQINNGAAGAPYYGREDTPWMDDVQAFSTQNALVLIDVDGKSVSARVLNPDTLEKIDEFVLR